MARSRRSVIELAKEALLNPEDALIVLWDSGFDRLETVGDSLGKRDLNRARRCLGLPTRRELKDPRYWENVLELNREGLVALLADLGFDLSSSARTLPRGTISRLKKRALKTHKPPAVPPSIEPPQEVPSLSWNPPGHVREINHVSETDVLGIHLAIVEDVAKTGDPIEPPGPRSEALLGGALFRPQTAIGGHLKYETVEVAAAALLHSLVLDHPFHNGNKRTALVTYLVFLNQNGVVLLCDENPLFTLVYKLARRALVPRWLPQRDDREVLAITKWTCQNSRLIERGDHPISWRKLKKILRDYDCEFDLAAGGGNRLNISRQTEIGTGWKGQSRTKMLATQVFSGGDGRDAPIGVLKKIRLDLALNYEHGVDAKDFYGKEPESAADFIARYRIILGRLARL